MRLRNVKYAKDKLAKHREFVVQKPEFFKGNWRELFGNNNPIHLEIGCGKGKFVYELAKANPSINYIGIEKFDSVIIRALEKLIEDPLNNLKLIRMDAEKIDETFSEDEVNKIYLNFSDPWPKKRTEKRRLTSEKFLKRYKNILLKESDVIMKTDNFNLFQFSIMSFNTSKNFQINEINLNLYRNLPEDNIQTEFEQKFVEQGNLIFYLKVNFIGRE